LPSEVHPEGTRALSVENPLGHGIAFRHNHKLGVLAVQYDTRVMGPVRILQYLTQKAEPSSLKIKPKLRSDDLWERFGRGETRTFEIAISNPQNMEKLADADEPVASAIRRMGDAYAAPKISIRMSMGHRRGVLRETIAPTIRSFFQAMSTGTLQVDTMKASVERGEGVANDDINFIDELLSEKLTLDLPENDPERSYKLRALALKSAMQTHGY
jgi:hypothetical protein